MSEEIAKCVPEMVQPEKSEKKTYSILYEKEFKKIGDSYEIRNFIDVLTDLGHKEFHIKIE